MSAEKPTNGHVPPEAEEDRTDRVFFAPSPDDASGERSGALRYVDDTDTMLFTADMVGQLRKKLREAEAREASGVRARPTPEQSSMEALEAAIDPLADLEIDVEAPHTLEELEEYVSSLPEIEIAITPASVNNFYGGHDREHPDGLYLSTYIPIAIGTPVYANVFLPAGFAFRTAAIVEWARETSHDGLPAGVGLKMCGLDARMRRLVRSFARHRKPLFYAAGSVK